MLTIRFPILWCPKEFRKHSTKVFTIKNIYIDAEAPFTTFLVPFTWNDFKKIEKCLPKKRLLKLNIFCFIYRIPCFVPLDILISFVLERNRTIKFSPNSWRRLPNQKRVLKPCAEFLNLTKANILMIWTSPSICRVNESTGFLY